MPGCGSDRGIRGEAAPPLDWIEAFSAKHQGWPDPVAHREDFPDLRRTTPLDVPTQYPALLPC
jgi:hypothetical protein